ncbi:MAG TPA: hypothetical protein VI168_08580 [Croceibacterium sp.]
MSVAPDGSPTLAQWLQRRADRRVELDLAAPEEHRADYMRVQARSLAREAVLFARRGLAADDPMPPFNEEPPPNEKWGQPCG